MRKTKIVATIGPVSESTEVLRELILAGVDVFRLNFAHGSYEEHGARIRNVRNLSQELDKNIAILQDLPGPKLRIGDIGEEGMFLEEGDIVYLVLGERRQGEKEIPLPIPAVFGSLKEGQKVLLVDGRLELEVRKSEDERIECRVVAGGELHSRQGISFPAADLPISSPTEEDIRHLRFGIDMDIDWVALSFVKSAKDIQKLRRIMFQRGVQIPIIAKIETKEAVDNLDSICEEADGIMVARGDLGLEIPQEEVPVQQKRIIKLANRLGKPCIVATQMLESMVENPRPTRAELADIANAILDGADALMLSEETTVGKYPVEAVRVMHHVARTTEIFADSQKTFGERLRAQVETVTDAIAISACQIAASLSARAIITVTSSGYTARMISRYRPNAPIIATTPEDKTLRRLAVVWGVYPLFIPYYEDTDEMLSKSIEVAREAGFVKEGDVVVLTGGVPIKVSGTTNLLKVHMISRILATGRGFGTGTITAPLRWFKEGVEVRGCAVALEKLEENVLPYLREAKVIITKEQGIAPYLLLAKADMDIPILTEVSTGKEVLKDGLLVTVDIDRGLILEGETKVI